MTIPAEAITVEMVEVAHEADIAGAEYGRYRRIIAALWPLIAAAERETIRDSAYGGGTFTINGRRYYHVPADLLAEDGGDPA